ncbi:MAG: molybdopterin guanine dinucleotide-containing S/N-oxide reductase [Proteobacteria bacterium]|nr:molybdopterin guanine dinucleotide-containing S/N-oxide reductase [Pseudomonadota bacterium]MDA1284890.1 molybdopterin guanine dinucleotide-containing S/N-oxide reductase [Pseudomonadota bacterium]
MPKDHDLPLTSTHWGTYRVEKSGHKVVALHPFEQDIDPSPIGGGIVDVLDGPTRITAPMVRKSWLENGPGSNGHLRGKEAFVEVSWQQAEILVAVELDRVRKTYGNKAIYAGSYGWASAGRFHHAQSQMKRFLNCVGGFTRSVNTYSFAAAEVIVPHILGTFRGHMDQSTTWPSIAENAELFVAFGGVPVKNGQINQGGTGRHAQREGLMAASANGVHFVSISPLKSDMIAEVGGDWISPRPGSDVALMLGLMHVLLAEGLQDQDFLDRYCEGFDKFRPYLLGETDGIAKTPEWAAAICAVPASTIRELARQMAGSRTMISISWSLTRQDHGEQPYWAAITLASMLGQIGLPGTGIGFGYSAVNSIGGAFRSIPGASLPQRRNPVKDFIPVARISDMLLNPGRTFTYDGETLTYPETKVVYWAGGNPFHHHQDLAKMVRAWAKPDTVIVNEWCWNASAKHADIVLPCTTHLEREDIGISPRDSYVIYMEKLAEPAGQARTDHAIFKGIAAAMGVEEQFTEGLSEAEWIARIYQESRDDAAAVGIALPELAELRKNRWFAAPPDARHKVMMRAFREDPDANPLNTPSGKIEIFSETVAGFGYADCPGHATWLEPKEWLGSARTDYPLHMISNQPVSKLHSQLDHGSVSRAAKRGGRETVTLHPDAAASRGLDAGDIVRVFNDRGACLASLLVNENQMVEVAQLSTGAWFDPAPPDNSALTCKHGNPNVLTRDEGTSSLAQGPVAHSCLIEVERFAGELPDLTAFQPPDIIGAD